ncbi:MAG: methyltransferase domain-containing protein [Pseudonocardiaceae bacterium]|nr:methyltransferase domain-containing protein [Pseudonocardiaceae bacterium]
MVDVALTKDEQARAHRARATLVRKLTEVGALHDPAWRQAVAEVPRHVLIPHYFDNGGSTTWLAVDSANPDQRDDWLDAVYSDRTLVNDLGTLPSSSGDTPSRVPTGSSSLPSLVVAMLEKLDVQADERVLEIGTGSGYSTALLCHRLGSSNVTSLDINPRLVDEARGRLAALHYTPTLIAGDGAIGYPYGAPYDRIIATCGVTHVPSAWIRQLGAGGRIVAPLDGTREGGLMVLDKAAPDEVTGRFDAMLTFFMPMRDDPDHPWGPARGMSHTARGCMAHDGTTDLDPSTLISDDHDWWLFLRLHLPGATFGHTLDPAGRRDGISVHTTASSAIAAFAPIGPDEWRTTQRGAGRIWDTVESARRTWERLGMPRRTRLGITALDDTNHQYVWLDDPNGAYSWPMPL